MEAAPPRNSRDAIKVLFDTDPGIDDAMALLFLQRHPAIDLVGITTVHGNAHIDITTRNALYLCERFGIETSDSLLAFSTCL